ncbi:hypothetical protein MPL3365_30299 [Mesorhizobium plurifarium]|uniref:Uncharacterized protein n=1 Tax=Mesorhizobium plurifarium TaxID=69974 RepID=A0A090G7H8_MESPL|nr:hypothetical protein MPL3365_30299 [Mesorhizobium plurifarium]
MRQLYYELTEVIRRTNKDQG